MSPAYLPGLQLAREFYAAVVRPLVDEDFPRVRYAAALLGPGSEVAGFDSQRTVDHDWGPRLQVFLTDSDAAQADAVTAMLASRLPESFRDYPVAFPVTREPGGLARHRQAPGGGRRPGCLADRSAGIRPAAWDHLAGLAGHSGAAAGRVHRRRGVSRRAG